MTPKNRAVKGRAGSREAPKLATQFPRIHFVGSSVNRSLTGLPSHIKESFPRLPSVLAYRSYCSTAQTASTTPLSFRVHQYGVQVLAPSFSLSCATLRDVSCS